ncbi:MAG TPA: MFS transporter [Vicinamibacterales bacterium]|jgi:ACS family glucarate transporter-like MFS transporter|nr:MFS transporter [Vicinamibacterales bacterium]
MTASRSRFTLLHLTFALSIITFIDRVCIASAAPSIRTELGLSAVQIGWIFSAFTFAYALFEIPSGWLGDRFGPRKVLMRIVLWWSAFTMATGITWNFASLATARFLFGAGEAGAYPNMSRSFARWFPAHECGTAHGVVFLGSRLGGAVTPPLVVLIISWAGWRASFWIFGMLGVVWSVVWWRWFRDDPAEHPSVNAEELAIITAGAGARGRLTIEWRRLLDRNLALVCLMYFCFGYGLYFYLTWLPTYFIEARGYTARQGSFLAGAVLLTGGISSIAGGRLTDVLVKRHGLRSGRMIGAVAFPLAGLCLTGVALTNSPLAAAVLMMLTAACADITLSPSWAICHDIGGEAAGTVTGTMNTLGNLGGAISPLVVGYSLEWWGSWSTPLLITAGVYLAGGVLTLMIDPRRRLLSDSATPAAAAMLKTTADPIR